MPSKAPGNTLKEQVVQVILPDGDIDARLASLDFKAGQLVLQQLSFDDSGEVVFGSSASVKFASIGVAVAEGPSVKLHGGNRDGRVLLELNFDGNAATAKAWADAIGEAKAAQKATAPVPDSPSSGGGDIQGDAAQMVTTLIEQQEEQVRLLETIIERKGEQLMQMQTHLEGALEKLQLGQELYGEQQRVVDHQQQRIQQLQARLKAASAAEAACTANAAQAAAGASAAAAAGASGPVACISAAGQNLRPPPPSPAADDDDDEEGEGEDADAEEERMLLAKLKELEAEKAQCEAQLRKEQGDILAQTQALQAMMASLGLPGSMGH